MSRQKGVGIPEEPLEADGREELAFCHGALDNAGGRAVLAWLVPSKCPLVVMLAKLPGKPGARFSVV